MTPARAFVVGLVALLSLASLPSIARAETFLFGYEGRGDGSTADMIAAQAQPLMDYLSSEMPEHDFQLRVYVPTIADEAPLLRAVNNKELDFWIADQRTEACLELAGTPTTVTAGTIVVRTNDTAIQTLDDIRDQRVATCESPLIPATVLSSHLLRARNLDLLLVARQVQRFRRLEEPLTTLMRGDADVAILEAGVLEMMVSNGLLDMADVRVLEEILPSALPYRHTTRTYPNEGVMSSKFSTRAIAIRSAVQGALQRLDPASTAATAMSGRGWASSVSNMAVVTVLEAMDMLELVDANALCHGRTVWQCPRNALQAGSSAELPCSRVPCPSGARCTCQPCILGDDVSIYPVSASDSATDTNVQLATDGIVNNYDGSFSTGFLVAGAVPSCRRTESCLQGTIGQYVSFELRDYLAGVRGTSAIDVSVSNAKGDVPVTVLAGDEPGQWIFSFLLSNLGQYSIGVKYGSEHAAESPFFAQAAYHTCTGSHEIPTDDGGCKCDSGYTASGGSCILTARLLAIQIVPAVLGVVLLCLVLLWLWRRHNDRQLLIPYTKLELDATPEALGSGSYGAVIAARFKGQNVAVKMLVRKKTGHGGSTARQGRAATVTSARGMVDSVKGVNTLAHSSQLTSTAKNGRRSFIDELRTMSKLKHPNIVLCFGGVLEKGRESMLIMERMDGTLHSLLSNETLDLGWDILSPLLRDVVFGLGYLHQNNVIHCDLKSTNVLVDSNLRAKISDFGLAVKCKATKGSPAWMAPELLYGESNTCASDVYALGILFSEMLTRQLPYTGMDLTDVLRRVAACDEADLVRPALPAKMPSGMQALVHSCWQNDQHARLTIEQVALQVESMDIQSLSMNLFARRADAKNQARVLNDVFPPHIADILKRGEKVKPEHRAEVTLFFSDIVGFTDISATLSPAKVSDMLDRLYTAFDGLVDKYDLFKVETIGDAYFCASNLVKDQPTHTELIARFSMDAIDAAMNTLVDLERPSLGCIKCRAGFHVGSVVTNVVGTKNPRYCLFGDTVNTASRMESSSIANHVHCSSTAAEALLAQCPALSANVKSRGVLNIKGKGEMETFWILLPNQSVDVAEDVALQARLEKSAKILAEAEEMVEDAQARHSAVGSKRGSSVSITGGIRKRLSSVMGSVMRTRESNAASKRCSELFSPVYSDNVRRVSQLSHEHRHHISPWAGTTPSHSVHESSKLQNVQEGEEQGDIAMSILIAPGKAPQMGGAPLGCSDQGRGIHAPPTQYKSAPAENPPSSRSTDQSRTTEATLTFAEGNFQVLVV